MDYVFRKSVPRRMFLTGFCASAVAACAPAGTQIKDVLVDAQLTAGFVMGVNSSGGKTDWLTPENGYMKIAYPENQAWGAVFITVGPPVNPPRPSMDFSLYRTLLIDMKGDPGTKQVDIGIKAKTQPDNGTEKKLPALITSAWRTHRFSLNMFTGADLHNLYVVAEWVFGGAKAQTVYVRNVRYSSAAV